MIQFLIAIFQAGGGDKSGRIKVKFLKRWAENNLEECFHVLVYQKKTQEINLEYSMFVARGRSRTAALFGMSLLSVAPLERIVK